MSAFKILFILICCLFSNGFFQSAAAQCVVADSALAEKFSQLGKNAQKRGVRDSVIIYFQKAKTIFEQANCWHGVTKISMNLTLAYSNQQNKPAYQENLYQTILLAQLHLSETDTLKAKIYQLLAVDFSQNNQLDSALHYLDIAQTIFKQAQTWNSYIKACRTAALIAQAKQDYKAMEVYVNEAYAVIKKHLSYSTEHLASISELYAVLCYHTGAYEEGLEKILEGLELIQPNIHSREDSSTLINFYSNIGLFYMEMGDIYKSEDYCNNAILLATQLENYYKSAMIYYNMAESFALRNEYNKAHTYYQKGLTMLQKAEKNASQQMEDSHINLKHTYINLNNGLAQIAPRINRSEEAMKALTENLVLHQKEPYRQEETYQILGEFYIYRLEYDKAESTLQQALRLSQKVYGEFHPYIADCYLLLGKLSEKQQKPNQALVYFDKAQRALSPAPTTSDIKPQNNASSPVSNRKTLLDLLYYRAQIQAQNNDKTAAYQTINQAVQLIDQMRTSFKAEGSKLFLQKQVVPIYELKIRLALDFYTQSNDNKYLEEAFRLMEKSKAMLLLDALKTEDARTFGNIPKDLLNEEKRLSREIAKQEQDLFEAQRINQQNEIADCQRKLLELRSAAQKLQATLETNYNKYYQLKYTEKIATLQQIQSHLDRNTLLLEFFVGNNDIYTFGITQKKAQLLAIPKTEHFENQVIALRSALTNVRLVADNPKAAYHLYTKHAFALYEQFVSPNLQPDVQRILVIPDGLFNYIPFEALLTEKAPALNKQDSTADFSQLAYLLQQYIVHYHYSASLMLFERPELKANGRILAFAPTFKYTPQANEKADPQIQRQNDIRSKINELPGAHLELEMLQSQFSGDYLFDADATEAAFKEKAQKENYSVIHLAMHGWVDEERPEYSSLIFTYQKDSVEDNLLHAYELNLLQLHADLVVLSACETGFGKYERGEGVVSIGRGFMYSGIPSLMMTLWSINDQATASLMEHFYTELSKSGLNKDAALRNAKLNYLKEAKGIAAHPFFWASFITVGDERPVYLQHKTNWKRYALSVLLLMLIGGGAFWALGKRRSQPNP